MLGRIEASTGAAPAAAQRTLKSRPANAWQGFVPHHQHACSSDPKIAPRVASRQSRTTTQQPEHVLANFALPGDLEGGAPLDPGQLERRAPVYADHDATMITP